MTKRQGFLSRLFGGGNESTEKSVGDCCSVHIEEVPADDTNRDQSANERSPHQSDEKRVPSK